MILHTEQSLISVVCFRTYHFSNHILSINIKRRQLTSYLKPRPIMPWLTYGARVSLWVLMFAKAIATPSPQQLKTDLTILFNNGLLG
jgi:hypothetical protein